MSSVAYHSDVRFLEECSPALVERNAAEFGRMRDLLASAEPSATKAATATIWESPHRVMYDARLSDARQMVIGLAEGFDRARTALMRYADAVVVSRQHLENGLRSETTLDELISRVATPITRTAQLAEPMHRWEDIRVRTGFFDGLAELGMDVDSIRDEASRAYDQAYDAFGRARSIEEAARQECLAELRAAHKALPYCRASGFVDADEMARRITPLRNEVAQAETDRRTHLPGAGMKPLHFPAAGLAAVSPALSQLRERLRTLPAAYSPWHDSVTGDWGDDGRREWVSRNGALIRAAAAEAGLPPDLVASIAWKEARGKPYFLDSMAEVAREAAGSSASPITPGNLPGPGSGDRDATSYGPMAIQIRRGAEVLGYDPQNLSEPQRNEVRSALQDPAQNIFIASKHLASLKAESGFADVPADQMTPGQYEELAARYNGGPHWQGTQAQNYGHDVMTHRHDAERALG